MAVACGAARLLRPCKLPTCRKLPSSLSSSPCSRRSPYLVAARRRARAPRVDRGGRAAARREADGRCARSRGAEGAGPGPGARPEAGSRREPPREARRWRRGCAPRSASASGNSEATGTTSGQPRDFGIRLAEFTRRRRSSSAAARRMEQGGCRARPRPSSRASCASSWRRPPPRSRSGRGSRKRAKRAAVAGLGAQARGRASDVEQRLDLLRNENAQKLEQMRATVDEKLQATLETRLGESFKLVSDRLEQVHKGLGEMQTLATGVGDLKRVLTNVKKRGTWGEMQLGALLAEVLTPGQYATNVETVPGSGKRVEYAHALPGPLRRRPPCWLPVDAKFPVEEWQRLQEAHRALRPRGRRNAPTRRWSVLQGAGPGHARQVHRAAAHQRLRVPVPAYRGPVRRDRCARPGLADELQREYRVSSPDRRLLAAPEQSCRWAFARWPSRSARPRSGACSARCRPSSASSATCSPGPRRSSTRRATRWTRRAARRRPSHASCVTWRRSRRPRRARGGWWGCWKAKRRANALPGDFAPPRSK